MAEEVKQDGQKTVVSFVVGLLIGGMLVWAFSGAPAQTPGLEDLEEGAEGLFDSAGDALEAGVGEVTESVEEVVETVDAPTLTVGDGKVVVNDQPASNVIALAEATYPVSEGWIGVRDLNADGSLSYILGVVRFSESQGLIPENIILQRATTPGVEYAVVVFAEDGDFEFDPRFDTQIDQVYATFTAQ